MSRFLPHTVPEWLQLAAAAVTLIAWVWWTRYRRRRP